MKKLCFLLILLSMEAFAGIYPVIDSGEVKINYPCGILNLIPKDKEEKEIITFFEKSGDSFHHQGFILRKRSGEEEDFTVKYRATEAFVLDDYLYGRLSNSAAGEMKCEFDSNYHLSRFHTSRSCSFKTLSNDLLPEHLEFIEMIKRPLSGFSGSLTGLRTVEIASTSWKLVLPTGTKNPFIKKPSVERWELKGHCLLEVSGKYQASSSSPDVIQAHIKEGLVFLQQVIKSAPDSHQGGKISWALGL
ncbi:MAG: hypothetical protein NDI69_04120 [Bacteriovoracaceae bacterium]|nr:hypothetical protein [Bacteriovoracaceae bacterium]